VSPAVSRLRRLTAAPARERDDAGERCELCGALIAPEHRHLLDVERRRLLCACRACALLLDRSGAGGGHYRLVPDRCTPLPGFDLDDASWRSLGIPVDLAFLFRSSTAGRVVAFYPGPMGATESLLPLEAWAEIEARNPVLAEMEEDVEALLVNRARGAREHWLVPVDRCYALVGAIRARWRGFGGGEEVWEEIERFFSGLGGASSSRGDQRREATWPRSGSEDPT
jgi:hypothetical protein